MQDLSAQCLHLIEYPGSPTAPATTSSAFLWRKLLEKTNSSSELRSRWISKGIRKSRALRLHQKLSKSHPRRKQIERALSLKSAPTTGMLDGHSPPRGVLQRATRRAADFEKGGEMRRSRADYGEPFPFPADETHAAVYKRHYQLGGAGSSGTIERDKSLEGGTHHTVSQRR